MIVLVCSSSKAYSIQNYRIAKKILENKIYINDSERETFYCKCNYTKSKEILTDKCRYKVRKDKSRGKRMEWEHIVPASFFGQHRVCWKKSRAVCGGDIGGRECCRKKDSAFRMMEGDMHNLVPSVGELNADRQNFPYDEVPEEVRNYGKCDFEVDFARDIVEPPEFVRGDIARAYLYMHDKYDIGLSKSQVERFKKWHKQDPPSEWEKVRNKRIGAIQGNINRHISEQ